LIELSNARADSVFKIMAGVTTAMTSSIGEKSFNSIYPRAFHTMPDMEQHFGTARNASGASVLAYAPIVLSNQLSDWAVYSDANQRWIEAINEQSLFNEGSGGYTAVDPILPFVWDYADDNQEQDYLKECKLGHVGDHTYADDQDYTGEPQGPGRGRGRDRHLDELLSDDRVPLLPKDGPFAPIWTFSPGPPVSDTTRINHDLYAKPRLEEAINSINLFRKPMFMDVCNLAVWFNSNNNTDDSDSSLEAVVGHPVYASFEPNATVVGNMIEIFHWHSFFENILSDVTKPVLVILENSCGHVATFLVRGLVATLVQAKADAHHPAYEYMAISAPFAPLINPPELVEQEDIRGICSYTMTIYPNEELEEGYLSSQPLWFAMVVLSVFFATSVLFFLFDRLMTRQRDSIIQTAKKQNLIVSSLFPKSVHAKMMEQVDADNDKLSRVGKAGLKQFITDEETGKKHGTGNNRNDSSKGGRRSGIPDKSKPIADLFPETTIMFGDIAG
jgi:hypothetical protein